MAVFEFCVNVLCVVLKSEILNRIMAYYGFRNKTELASFLGVSSQTVSNWYSRNSIDYDLVFERCAGLDLNWLIAGTVPDYGHSAGGVGVASDVNGVYDVSSTPGYAGGADAEHVCGRFAGEGLTAVFAMGRDFMAFMADDAMPARFRSGDILICKRIVKFDVSEIDPGKPYVFTLKEGGSLARRLHVDKKKAGRLCLVAENPDRKTFPDRLVAAGDLCGVWEIRCALTSSGGVENRVDDCLSELERKVDGLVRQNAPEEEV